MTIGESNSGRHESDEQGENGVQTGFDQAQAFDFLENAAASWEQRTRLDGALFLSLIRLSKTHPGQAIEGFTAQDLAEEMRSVLGRGWARGDTSDVIADRVRKTWKRLTEELWPQKQEGVTQLAIDTGLHSIPYPERIEGGGSGRPTRYRLSTTPVNAPTEAAISDEAHLAPGEVRYICEDLEDAGLIARFFSRGYQIVGWRRWALALTFAGAFFLALMAILLLIAIANNPVQDRGAVYWLFVYGVAGWLAWITIMRILILPDTRIGPAPWWIQLGEEDRLVEWRCPPKYPNKAIKAARYTGMCPRCGGKVIVKGGSLAFWGRLVGRCEESPREHVFSFDHITRLGRPLR